MAMDSRTMPLPEAVIKILDGEMCPLCSLVAKAKQQERSRSDVPEARIESKLLFFFQAVPKVMVEAPGAVAWLPSDSPAMTAVRSAPPVPPPRAALA